MKQSDGNREGKKVPHSPAREYVINPESDAFGDRSVPHSSGSEKVPPWTKGKHFTKAIGLKMQRDVK